MRAKLFISNHPGDLLLYKNLIRIIKKYDKNTKIILFKVNHPYFLKFNFELYKKYFDKIIEFDFINYKKNFLAGLWEIFTFQKKLKIVTTCVLRNFDAIDLFLGNSAWLPVNVLLNNLSREKNIKNITKFTFGGLECEQTKIDRTKTFLCKLYSLPFKCYKIRAISTLGGKFVDFVYAGHTPGTLVRVVNPTASVLSNSDWEKENILPYPIITESLSTTKKDMVVIFGDASIPQYYSEYIPRYEIFVEKLVTLFKNIEDKYPDCKLYYKPHPGDEEKLMSGIDPKKYRLFDNTVNAQMLFDMYHQRIKAIYTFSSSSIIFGSFWGIPSYTFYRYLCNPTGIKKFDSTFNQDNIKSKFLFHISKLNEIGEIDNLEYPNFVDLKNLDDKYRKILNI